VFILVAALAGSTEMLAAQVEISERAQARRLLLEASRLIDEVPESQRSSAVANIASQLSRNGDLEDALRVSQSQKNPRDQDLATGLIAWNLVQQGNVGQALRLVESISDTWKPVSPARQSGECRGVHTTPNQSCVDYAKVQINEAPQDAPRVGYEHPIHPIRPCRQDDRDSHLHYG
jgi:hypothetical protein